MSFTVSSFIFAFLPVVVALYYLLNLFNNKKLLNIYLILVSLSFYATTGFTTAFKLIIFISMIYFLGKFLEKDYSSNIFYLSVAFVILILIYYKYVAYILILFSNVSFLNSFTILVPLGMSFIMFESISYLVDIYIKREKSGSIIDAFLFFTFFPKVTQGPIVLWRDFAPQISKRNTSIDLFFSGLERIMIGFIKKCLIADILGEVVFNITSNNVNGIDSISAIVGAFCYFLQLYYDFSGYSDMAIGMARLFGFQFKENFNYPYTSTSIGEFWRRWHISLGTWFRTYIYIPLGGNRKNVYINLFIVFLLTGIWHGSTLNFVLWGVIHGLVVMFERLVKNKNWYINTPALLKWLITMLIVYFTWIIFMLPTFTDVYIYFKSIVGIPNGNVYFTYKYFLTNKIIFIIIIAFVGAVIGKFEKIRNVIASMDDRLVLLIIKEIVLIIFFILSILTMLTSSFTPFLYFQF